MRISTDNTAYQRLAINQLFLAISRGKRYVGATI